MIDLEIRELALLESMRFLHAFATNYVSKLAALLLEANQGNTAKAIVEIISMLTLICQSVRELMITIVNYIYINFNPHIDVGSPSSLIKC